MQEEVIGVSIRREDPPPRARRNNQRPRGYWDPIAKQLRDDPGEWYLISEDEASGIAYRIPKGVIAAFRPAGAFEVRTEGIPVHDQAQRRCKVWARYVGEV